MNLLLLLSALLSALTGVGASARQPQVAQAVAQQARVAAPRLAAAPAARPVAALPAPALLAAAPLAARWTLAAAEPLFAGRRRE
ncbi:hypothetical protein [Sphingomonas corticis]|uniref:Uncharacterized protein n=1 Tax=Sphingomonas corticis TaxID=2722791 RepID=A0ABX1CRT7_9SPHN|nr:hypothetical protein [Sphingomonas corticis]